MQRAKEHWSNIGKIRKGVYIYFFVAILMGLTNNSDGYEARQADEPVEVNEPDPVEPEPVVTEKPDSEKDWVQIGTSTVQIGSTMVSLRSIDEGDKIRFEFHSLGSNGMPAVFTGMNLVVDGEIEKSKGITNAQPKASWEIESLPEGYMYQLKVDLTASPATIKMFRWE